MLEQCGLLTSTAFFCGLLHVLSTYKNSKLEVILPHYYPCVPAMTYEKAQDPSGVNAALLLLTAWCEIVIPPYRHRNSRSPPAKYHTPPYFPRVLQARVILRLATLGHYHAPV